MIEEVFTRGWEIFLNAGVAESKVTFEIKAPGVKINK